MSEKIIFRRKIGSKNKKCILVFPEEITNFLKILPGQEIIIEPENGKHGKYISIYKEEINDIKKDEKVSMGDVNVQNSETTE